MIFHIFDPGNKTSSISVKADPGRIFIGQTNFIDLRQVDAIELTPIQATLLMVTLQKAISAELSYSESWEKERNSSGDNELL